jgi:hypothetical protein
LWPPPSSPAAGRPPRRRSRRSTARPWSNRSRDRTISTGSRSPRWPPRGRTRVPYSAVIYDAEGGAWAYVADGELSYVRHALTVDEIVADTAGDYAVLAEGPAEGETVVSVGVAELFGAEFEVGH